MKTSGKSMFFFLFSRIFLENKACLLFLIILDKLIIQHLIFLPFIFRIQQKKRWKKINKNQEDKKETASKGFGWWNHAWKNTTLILWKCEVNYYSPVNESLQCTPFKYIYCTDYFDYILSYLYFYYVFLIHINKHYL